MEISTRNALGKGKFILSTGRRAIGLIIISLLRKWMVLTKGSSKISASCQIPKLENIYSSIGLHKRDGLFVEIGGYDGESFSNTSFLADQGWRGVYIEPLPENAFFIVCRHWLNNIRVIMAAISKSENFVDLHSMGPLSTSSNATREAFKEISWATDAAKQSVVRRVRGRTLESAFKSASIPDEFDLLVVDVEGLEEEIIDQLASSLYRPSIIVAELEDSHPDFKDFPNLIKSHKRAREKICKLGYSEIYSDEINTIFKREKGE